MESVADISGINGSLYTTEYRGFDSRIGRWWSIDPLSIQRSNFTPYDFCSLNPINNIDPLGSKDDWVRNKETDEYVWMDNVNSENNTPNGFKYIGPDANNILEDMNLQSTFETIRDSRKSFGLDGDNRAGAPVGTGTVVIGNLQVDVNIEYNKKNVNSTNKYGRTFSGIAFTADFDQVPFSPNPDFEMNYNGFFGIDYGNREYSSFFSVPEGVYLYSEGTCFLQAKILIPASSMRHLKVFKSAYICLGVTNNSLFISPKPMNLLWDIQKNTEYLPD